jgi:cation diffusion facilitator CzcD-associated flavoprotein CzcO
MEKPKRIAVIGAGAAGLAQAKQILDAFQGRTVELVIYEARNDVGGVWCVFPSTTPYRVSDSLGLDVGLKTLRQGITPSNQIQNHPQSGSSLPPLASSQVQFTQAYVPIFPKSAILPPLCGLLLIGM